MAVRRNLIEMYQTGRELEFAEGAVPVLDAAGAPVLDDYGAPVTEPEFVETVWVQKTSKLDHKAAVRAADAAKALVLADCRDHDSETFKAALGMVEEVCHDDHDLMVEFLVADKLASRQEAIGAEIEGEEVDGDDGPEPSEWKKDNYLQGLFDLWHGTGVDDELSLNVRYAQNPEDPEAKRVFAEMARFIGLVDERMNEERVEYLAEFAPLDVDQLRYKVAELHLESRSNQVWFEEFNACRTFLALRKPEKHGDYYLQSRAHVDRLQPLIAEAVIAALDEMTVDVVEGKGSPATRTFSL